MSEAAMTQWSVEAEFAGAVDDLEPEVILSPVTPGTAQITSMTVDNPQRTTMSITVEAETAEVAAVMGAASAGRLAVSLGLPATTQRIEVQTLEAARAGYRAEYDRIAAEHPHRRWPRMGFRRRRYA